MAKLTSAQQKEQLNRLFAKYNLRLGMLYSSYVKKLASLGYGEDVLEGDELFNFDNFPELKARPNDIFNDYFQNSLMLYKQGITDGVSLAYTHDNDVLGNYTILSDKALQTARKTAAATFIANRLNSKKGLNLAQTVWNYCSQTKSEFEVAMSNTIADGIKHGTSAEEIGKTIRKYLNNPDMMYRRYHTIKVQKNGKKKDVVTWRRRRIIDGKVRFVEEPLEKVGMGVYRSSRKNALRVARTEINAAYHKARNERWANEPFVIGQYIHVSPQHAIEDICDEVEGRYPKDFVWTSWHPSCICTSDPIMIEGEEKKEFYHRLMNGEDMSGYVSPYAVTDVPDKYKQYIINNQDAIVRAVKKDKLAWHLADNKKYWTGLLSKEQREELGLTTKEDIRKAILDKAKLRHSQRTQEQIDKIQEKWNTHRRKLYNERVKTLINAEYISDKLNGGDLFERYYAGRAAIADGRSVSEVNSIFDRFKKGWEVKQMWTDRKVAMNVLKVAQKYGETDISAVQSALNVADYAKARQEAKKLAKAIKAIQIDEAELSKLIPDVNTWHKQFTSEQLHGVYDAVENKLSQWSSLTLEQKQKKLHFEAYDFLGGNMHGVQQKYATWQVSQDAYIKELIKVNDAIEWGKIQSSLQEVYDYNTQSKVYHKLVYDLKNAVAQNDLSLTHQLLDEAQQKKQALIDLKLKRAANKNASGGSIPFDSQAYTQARKDAAFWARNKNDGDDYFRPFAEQDWKRWTQNEKEVAYNYTSGSSYINEPCYTTYYSTKHGINGEIRDSWKDINTLSDMIDKSTPFTRDVWLNRGGSTGEFFGQFGVNLEYDMNVQAACKKLQTDLEMKKDLLSFERHESKKQILKSEIAALEKQLAKEEANLITTDLSQVIGKEGVNKPFMSTAHTKGYGFVGSGEDNVSTSFVYNIYCPKGTKGIYAEPYSAFGTSNYSWDGKSGAHHLGSELEVILQRGTRFRVTKVSREYNNGSYRWFVDIEVIEQPIPIPNTP